MNYKETSNITRAEQKIKSNVERIVGRSYAIEVSMDTDGSIEITGEDYYAFQDDGVKGTKSGFSKAGYSYKDKMPPPSAFSKYTNDRSAQFAIAKSIQQDGIKAHNYTDKILNDNRVDESLDDIALDYVDQMIDKTIK